MLQIVKEHPACMVALTIDEEGMAVTADKKFQIASRLYDVWVNEYNLMPEDLIIDALTFSIGSGDETLKNADTAVGVTIILVASTGSPSIAKTKDIGPAVPSAGTAIFPEKDARKRALHWELVSPRSFTKPLPDL